MKNELNGFEVEEFNIYNLPTNCKTSTCPKCSSERKKKTDKCMSVFWDTGLGQCNHCGSRVQLHTYKKIDNSKNYVRPVLSQNKVPYSDLLRKYISNVRGLDLSVLEELKIREAKEWMPQTKKLENCICFDYYFNGELMNTKYRDGKKNFKLYQGAEKILYNLDSVIGEDYAVIVEGEFDVLAYVSSGVKSVVSVPNGFNDKGIVNSSYLDEYMYLFDDKKTIYIAIDNDAAGLNGRAELIRRFGFETVKIVDFLDCKDANDFLLKYGKDELANTLSKAEEIKIDGVFSAKDVKDSMYNSYRNGQRRGTTTYVKEIDDCYTWREGEVTLWTGYQNEGKSLMLNQLCAVRAYWEYAKVAVFSPENMPLDDFFTDIIEMFVGKSADPFYEGNYMTEQEYQEGYNFVEKNFFMIYPEKDFSLESIFDRIRFLIKRNGIRTAIIDPYNTIEHKMTSGAREDLYISGFMSQLKKFAVENNISIHLVAHQLTPKKNDKDGGRYFKPDLNSIKGGGTFSDKADNVVYVWRPNRALDFTDRDVVFGSQKIKKQKLVGKPKDIDNISFCIKSNRYFFNGISPFQKIDAHRGVVVEDKKTEEKPIRTMSPLEAFGENKDLEIDLPF